MARILVVDDSEDLQEVYDMIFAGEGHQVARAYDGAAGLLQVAQFHPDVVLLDMMMPEVDGLTFLARLPKERQGALPAVVANSGMAAYRDEALRRGAFTFLVKPASREQLLAVVDAALAQATVDPHVIDDNAQSVADTRAQAAEATAELVAHLPPSAISSLKGPLRALVRWIRGYYGFGEVHVHLLRGDQLSVEALAGESLVSEGDRIARKNAYCDFVIDSGSNVVVSDPEHHPLAAFSQHPDVAAGFRFYAGVPVTASQGTVIGTLCIVDWQPHDVHCEDMRLLKAVGLRVARAMEEIAYGLPAEDFVIDSAALLAGDLLPVLVEVAIERASRRGSAVGLALIDLIDGGTASDCAASCYREVGGPGVALLRRGRRQLTMVADGEPEPLQRKLEQACAVSRRTTEVHCVAVASLVVQQKSNLSREEAQQIQHRLFRRVAESRSAAMERGATM